MNDSGLNQHELSKRLAFLKAAEQLKDTLRSAHTSQGKQESVAEHTWRLTLMVLVFADMIGDIDLLRLLKICILHDLGEAVDGDIPAPKQSAQAPKSDKERADFLSLMETLPSHIQQEFMELWDDYDNVTSPEAVLAKAFDKLETLIQHNQGKNPADFDYEFNLGYGKRWTTSTPLTAAIRHLLDAETMRHDREGR